MSNIRHPQKGELWKGPNGLARIIHSDNTFVVHGKFYQEQGEYEPLDSFLITHTYYHPINLSKSPEDGGFGLIPDYQMGLNYFLDKVNLGITNTSAEPVELPEEMSHLRQHLLGDERYGITRDADKVYVSKVGSFTIDEKELLVFIAVMEYENYSLRPSGSIDNFQVKLLVTDLSYSHAHTSPLTAFAFALRNDGHEGSSESVVDGSRRCIYSDYYLNIKLATIETIEALAIKDLSTENPKESPYIVWRAGVANNVKQDHSRVLDLDGYIKHLRKISSL